MHRRAPGRPRGGSGGLTHALARRLERLGGRLSVGDGARRITATTVETASGRRIESRAVVSAAHIVTTLELLGDESLRRRAVSRLKVGHGMGVALRVVTDRLPSYGAAVDDVHVGMQLLVRSGEQLRAAYADYLHGRAPRDPPLLVMTPTATDPSLAPEGRHVVTVWSQWHPHRLHEGTWDSVRERETDRLVAAVDGHAPGFAASVQATLLQTPADLESELDLRAGNVMHLDMTLDAMFGLRPLPEWSGYRGPDGVFLCGASTHPGGGVSGASGRNAAAVVIGHLRGRRRKT
jgi:phytoene dehydrogenase-like protein